MRRLLIAHGNFLFRFRNGLFPLCILLAVLAAKPTYPFGSAAANDAVDALGLLAAAAGAGLRVLTIGYRYVKRGGRDKKVYASSMVTEGVFAHCRNPMYVGNLLIFLGVALVAHAPLLYAVGLPLMTYVYAAIVAAEEHYLRGRFGEAYDAYCRRVPRWLPAFRGFSQTVAGIRFNWPRVIVKEYGTVFGLVMALLGVRIWSLYEAEGSAALPAMKAWAWGALPACVAYAIARWLKKSRKLSRDEHDQAEEAPAPPADGP